MRQIITRARMEAGRDKKAGHNEGRDRDRGDKEAGQHESRDSGRRKTGGRPSREQE